MTSITRSDLHRLLDEVVEQEKKERSSIAWIHGASWVLMQLSKEHSASFIDKMVVLHPSKEAYIRTMFT